MTRPWLLVASGGITTGALLGWPGAIAFVLLATLSAAATRQGWLPIFLVAGLFAVLGVARAAMHHPETIDDIVLASDRAVGVVTGQPQIGPSGERAVLKIERIRKAEGEWMEADGSVLVFFRGSAPGGITAGDRVEVIWSVNGPEELEPGFRRFVRSTAAGGTATAFDTRVIARGESPANILVRLRGTVTRGIERAVEGDAGSLLAGFVTGDDSGLSEASRDAFERTNTSHITAVSGSNVAILLSLWFFVLPTRRLQRSLLAILVILAIIWLYVVLVGMGAGAVRAGLFATLMVPAARLGRRPEPLTALLAASAVMLLVRPAYSDSAGFWLSMAASTAMVTVVATGRRGARPAIVGGLAGLVAAQVATFPISYLVFDQWSPGSMIANLAIGPLVSAVFPLAFLTALAVTAFPWLGGLIGWLPALGATAIISIVQAMARELPLIRTGEVGPTGAGLVTALCLTAIVIMSDDARRWLRRLDWARPRAASLASAIVIGTALGIWVGSLVFATLQ